MANEVIYTEQLGLVVLERNRLWYAKDGFYTITPIKKLGTPLNRKGVIKYLKKNKALFLGAL